MKHYNSMLLGLLLIDMPAIAENGVYKCTGADGTIAYQGTPCRDRQVQVTLVEPRKREPDALPIDTGNGRSVAEAGAKPATEAGGGEKRSLLAADELVPGMSDTKVLNMRGWGRPTHIARSRGEGGWREEWTYVARADGATRTVQFLNGKVAGSRSQDAQQVAVARATVPPEQQVVRTSPHSSTDSAGPTMQRESRPVVQPQAREEQQLPAVARLERPAERGSAASASSVPVETTTTAPLAAQTLEPAPVSTSPPPVATSPLPMNTSPPPLNTWPPADTSPSERYASARLRQVPELPPPPPAPPALHIMRTPTPDQLPDPVTRSSAEPILQSGIDRQLYRTGDPVSQ